MFNQTSSQVKVHSASPSVHGKATGSAKHQMREQPTVTYPIGDRVNVLNDYKKTGRSTILKRLTCRCHHLIDMLVEFTKNHVFLILLKWLDVPYPSMFANVCMTYYAHVYSGKKFPKFFRLLKSYKKPHVNRFFQQTWQCPCSKALISDYMIFLNFLYPNLICSTFVCNTPGSLTEA